MRHAASAHVHERLDRPRHASAWINAHCEASQRCAKETDRSVHSLIVEAVEKHAAYEEQMRSLVKEAISARSGYLP